MRRACPLLAVVALLAIAGVAATAVTATPYRAAGRETQLQRALDRVVAAGVPGAVLLVREGDRTIRLASGSENLKPRTPMRADDRFRVGSITKTFVATVVLQLVGERRLALEDTVERWLPGVVPNGKRITLHQLLNHTSGLFDYGGDRKFIAEAYRHPLKDWTPRQIVAVATAHKPRFAPGMGWSYSDTNYYVLGLIVEAATKHSLARELRDRIFTPLRLRATSLPSAPAIAGRYAHGYFLRPRQDVSVGSPSVFWAAGALVEHRRPSPLLPRPPGREPPSSQPSTGHGDGGYSRPRLLAWARPAEAARALRLRLGPHRRQSRLRGERPQQHRRQASGRRPRQCHSLLTLCSRERLPVLPPPAAGSRRCRPPDPDGVLRLDGDERR